jgi:acetyl esterase
MWPIVDADFETDSYHQFGDKRFLTVPTMKWMYDMYIADPEKRQDIGFLTSESMMELEQLPEHLIVLGSGYIGLEFAQMFRRFGCRVTVIGQSVSNSVISRSRNGARGANAART